MGATRRACGCSGEADAVSAHTPEAAPLAWYQRGCEGQSTWGALRVCEVRYTCARFMGAPPNRRLLELKADEVGPECSHRLFTEPKPSDG